MKEGSKGKVKGCRKEKEGRERKNERTEMKGKKRTFENGSKCKREAQI